jgi:hypothetical protein
MTNNGYRNSYGVVTAMFGVTIGGCFVFRTVLIRLNKRLDDGTDTWVVKDNIAEQKANIDGVSALEAGKGMKDFRYIV